MFKVTNDVKNKVYEIAGEGKKAIADRIIEALPGKRDSFKLTVKEDGKERYKTLKELMQQTGVEETKEDENPLENSINSLNEVIEALTSYELAGEIEKKIDELQTKIRDKKISLRTAYKDDLLEKLKKIEEEESKG